MDEGGFSTQHTLYRRRNRAHVGGMAGRLAITALCVGLMSTGCGSDAQTSTLGAEADGAADAGAAPPDAGPDPNVDGGAQDARPAGDSGSAVDAGDAPLGCDAVSPADDPCAIDEQFAVFAAPTGDDDTADGTRAAPFGTIERAIEEAVAQGKRVFACADGEFERLVTIRDSVELFGGFRCVDWSWDDEARATIKSPGQAPIVLRIQQASEVLVSHIAVVANDAASPGRSSIGVFVVESSNVILDELSVTAGAGMAGENGSVTPFTYLPQASLNGSPASGADGGRTRTCSCDTGDDSIGGVGGFALSGGASGGRSGLPSLGGGAGGIAGPPCGSGGDGALGASPAPGVPGDSADSLGTLTSAGWQPSIGAPGGNGSTGQGGGGGASTTTAGGGGGGCGGCGGAGASPGQGGGGSIAVAIIDSPVAISGGSLIARDAGRGGDGVAGQQGQRSTGSGGSGGPGACTGGSGGAGSDGGRSGGGAGGISVAVLWTGTEPTVVDTVMTVGAHGRGGFGAPSNGGVSGVAEQLFELP